MINFETITKTVDRNTVIMKKGPVRIIIALRDTKVIIINIDKNCIPYVFYGTNEDAYMKYLHLMGKMILKDPNSKYFGIPKYYESCKNGKPNGIPPEEWITFANEIKASLGF